jgi:hypothetical protein
MSFKVEIKGLDEMKRNSDRMKRNLKAFDGVHPVPIEELVTPAFLRAHSDFDSSRPWLGVATSSSPVINSLPTSFVRFPTRRGTSGLRRRRIFPDWKRMQEAAAADYLKRKIEEGL